MEYMYWSFSCYDSAVHALVTALRAVAFRHSPVKAAGKQHRKETNSILQRGSLRLVLCGANSENLVLKITVMNKGDLGLEFIRKCCCASDVAQALKTQTFRPCACAWFVYVVISEQCIHFTAWSSTASWPRIDSFVWNLSFYLFF